MFLRRSNGAVAKQGGSVMIGKGLKLDKDPNLEVLVDTIKEAVVQKPVKKERKYIKF